MLITQKENYLAKIMGFGATFVSVLVVTGTVTDPVNLTKLFALGGVAGACFAICSTSIWELVKKFKLIFVIITIFLIASANSIIHSDSPLTQNIYGAYGRNTGFLTYLLFLMLFSCALTLRQRISFDYIIWGLIVAGLINNVYCLWVIIFGDFVSWNNPYGNILGTFGNPNFIGAFLGMYTAGLIAYAVTPGVSNKFRILTVFFSILSLFEIINSHAIQGRVVLAGGLAIIGFYILKSKFNSKLILIGYSTIVVLAGVVSLLGALQIGPLTKFIYKYSVSLRGEYWQAGWNMAQSHPLTGVGFDSYGDWYRRARDVQALVVPGPNTVTNASHNVPIDVLAYGGWPLFLAYLSLVLISSISIIRFTLRNREYDGRFVALAVAWICYQIQSLISINQIGLAIWGWILGGALIAYERNDRISVSSEVKNGMLKSKIKSNENSSVFSPQLLASIGAVIGLIIACPPYSADSKYYSAISSQDVSKIESALVPSYLSPPNSYKFAYTADILESSQLYDLSLKYAKKAIEFNPNHFDSWRVLYVLKNSSKAEKSLAMENLRRLDPNNKEFIGIGP